MLLGVCAGILQAVLCDGRGLRCWRRAELGTAAMYVAAMGSQRSKALCCPWLHAAVLSTAQPTQKGFGLQWLILSGAPSCPCSRDGASLAFVTSHKAPEALQQLHMPGGAELLAI